MKSHSDAQIGVALSGADLSIFNSFDTIRIINLPARTDRRREMEAELRALQLIDDPRVRFFNGIRPAKRLDFTSVGARGVFEGHKALLQEAAAAGQSILILEDDCAFRADAADYRTDEPWDIFYGGYKAADPQDLPHSDIEMAHMMGFTARGARLVADYLERLRYTGDHPPIDAAYVWFRRAHPEVATAFAVPPLAWQRSSPSDIAPKPWDRLTLTRTLATAYRKLRNSRPRRQGA
jgi:glycosyl transferase family 25